MTTKLDTRYLIEVAENYLALRPGQRLKSHGYDMSSSTNASPRTLRLWAHVTNHVSHFKEGKGLVREPFPPNSDDEVDVYPFAGCDRHNTYITIIAAHDPFVLFKALIARASYEDKYCFKTFLTRVLGDGSELGVLVGDDTVYNRRRQIALDQMPGSSKELLDFLLFEPESDADRMARKLIIDHYSSHIFAAIKYPTILAITDKGQLTAWSTAFFHNTFYNPERESFP